MRRQILSWVSRRVLPVCFSCSRSARNRLATRSIAASDSISQSHDSFSMSCSKDASDLSSTSSALAASPAHCIPKRTCSSGVSFAWTSARSSAGDANVLRLPASLALHHLLCSFPLSRCPGSALAAMRAAARAVATEMRAWWLGGGQKTETIHMMVSPKRQSLQGSNRTCRFRCQSAEKRIAYAPCRTEEAARWFRRSIEDVFDKQFASGNTTKRLAKEKRWKASVQWWHLAHRPP